MIMKRVTFVFVGIVAITASTLAFKKNIENSSQKIVKVDVQKHQLRGFYD